MVHSVFYVKHSGIVPIIKSQHYQRVPPLMRRTNIIHPTFNRMKNFGNINRYNIIVRWKHRLIKNKSFIKLKFFLAVELSCFSVNRRIKMRTLL